MADRSDDKGNLLNMYEKAKEVLGVETITNLADKGYYDGEDIAQHHQLKEFYQRMTRINTDISTEVGIHSGNSLTPFS